MRAASALRGCGAKRASHVADNGGGGNHAAVCSELRSAEAREVELHKLLAASLCEMGALIHEWAPATLESRPSVLPTAAPFGALGNHGGNSHIALRLAARRGYELLPCAFARGPWAQLEAGEAATYARGIGPLARGESDPLLALHACDWMPRVDLPRRYAQLVPVTDAAGTVHSELRLCELHEGGGSVWTALEHAGRFAEEALAACCRCAPRLPRCRLRTCGHGRRAPTNLCSEHAARRRLRASRVSRTAVRGTSASGAATR